MTRCTCSLAHIPLSLSNQPVCYHSSCRFIYKHPFCAHNFQRFRKEDFPAISSSPLLSAVLLFKPTNHSLFFTILGLHHMLGLPSGSAVKNPTCNEGDKDSIPGMGRSPGEGNGNPLQHSCLGNPMDRGAWQDTVHGVKKS